MSKNFKVTGCLQTHITTGIGETYHLYLKELAKLYIGVTNPQGFLTDLRMALGIPDSQGASKYAYMIIPQIDGGYLQGRYDRNRV